MPRSESARARAERVVEERLGSAMLTVANLCRWTGMSRSSLYRLFDGDGGVQAFIRTRRLARVAEELRTGSPERVADIAERWGFCDAAYLARVFREMHGVTPSAYRAAHFPARPPRVGSREVAPPPDQGNDGAPDQRYGRVTSCGRSW